MPVSIVLILETNTDFHTLLPGEASDNFFGGCCFGAGSISVEATECPKMGVAKKVGVSVVCNMSLSPFVKMK